MGNSYKSFYLEDLKAIIHEVALEVMLPTIICADDDVQNMIRNANTAVHNDGVRTMTNNLINTLTELSKE